jgi:uncharacterized protein YcbX
MPYLSRITLFPVKSFDGVDVDRAQISTGGALVGDRTYAFFSNDGKFINGKRTPLIHRIRASYDLANRSITVQVPEQPQSSTFSLEDDRLGFEDWLSRYLSLPAQLAKNEKIGFPDDTKASGPTVVSVGTIAAVSNWFQDLDPQEISRRFRTNLEISDVPPFWEEQLYGKPDQAIHFQIGNVTIQGINPCQRCIVPTRDSQTGAAYPQFQKLFNQKRQATLPPWTESSRFNHFYKLTVNTYISPQEAGKHLQVGDTVQMQAS